MVRRAFAACLALALAACSGGDGAENASIKEAAYQGAWVLVATDADGTKVYLERDSVRQAGDRKIADLGFVSTRGRKVNRLSFGCDDRSASFVSSFGDDVETTADLTGDHPHGPGEHFVIDYVCGHLPMPAASTDTLPSHL